MLVAGILNNVVTFLGSDSWSGTKLMFGNLKCSNRALPHALLVQTHLFSMYPDESTVCKTVSRGGEETRAGFLGHREQYFKKGNGIGF